MSLRSNEFHPLIQKFPRTGGFIVWLIGVVFFYFAIVEPILYATAEKVIKLSGKGAFGGGLFMIMGLLLMLLGPRLIAITKAEAASSRKFALIFGGVLAIIGIIALEMTKTHLRSKGYVLR
jgi:hypothetical protein